MKKLLAIPIVLLLASFAVLAESPEPKALDKLLEAIRAADAKAAQQAYEQLGKDFSGKEVMDEATWNYALFHLRQEKLDKGQNLLLSLKRPAERIAGCPRP